MTSKEEKYYINCIIDSLENDVDSWRWSLSDGELIRNDGLRLWYNGGWKVWNPNYDIQGYWIGLKFSRACKKAKKNLEEDPVKKEFEKFCKKTLKEERKEKLNKLK